MPTSADASMQDKLRERLEKLKEEFARGKEQLGQAESRALTLRETLLRISGAIQVLEEELGITTHAPE